MDRLTPDDRVILWPDELWPQDIGALVILDGAGLIDASGRFRIDAVRQLVASRLHLMPRFRQVLSFPRRGLGGPLWVDAPSFDLREHVGVVTVPAPGSEEQLLLAVERLRCRRLDRSRPLWEMWFLTGLPERRVGLFVRLHHVVADGIAGVTSIAAFFDTVADAPPQRAPPWIPAPAPRARALLADHLRRRAGELRRARSLLARPATSLRQARAAWPALRELVDEGPTAATSLNRVIGPDRTLALLRSDLTEVRSIAHAWGATVNDVVLAVIAGGLRGLLAGRGEPVEGLSLRAYVPVSLRQGQRVRTRANLISQMVVPLPIGETDPVRRLRQIAAETTTRKARPRPALGAMFRSRVVSAALLQLIRRRPVNITTADIPGPQQPLYLAGARVLEVFPLLNLIGNVSLGVGALSYDGHLGILVVADRDAHSDLDVFVASAHHELRALSHSIPGRLGPPRKHWVIPTNVEHESDRHP